jgi:hypothetical protein
MRIWASFYQRPLSAPFGTLGKRRVVFESPKQIGQKGPSALVGVIVVAVALVGGTAAWLLYQRAGGTTEGQSELTEEARSYLPNLALSNDTGMTAKDDALGQTLLEITGAVTNNGGRVCSLVAVNVVFRDPNGLEIDRQQAAIVDQRSGPLEPGETQQFRMAFDNVPEGWNQAFPSLFISEIRFGGQ